MWSARSRVLSVVAPLACALASAAPGSAQSPAALVAQFRGDVKVTARVGGAETPARVGLRLVEGDSVDVPRGSRAVLLFNNGRLVTATSPLVIASVGGAGAHAIHARTAAALADARNQVRPDSAAGIGRPPPAGAYPLEPVAGAGVLDRRPTFRWQADGAATSYVLQVRPVSGGPPRRFTVEGDGPFMLPDTASALDDGVEYAWTVIPAGSGRVPGEERFRVLDADARAALDAFHDDLAAAGLDAESDGLLLAAAFYTDLGLLHEAEVSLQRLRGATPDDRTDALVHLLEARVLEGLGRVDEALRAFDRAAAGSP